MKAGLLYEVGYEVAILIKEFFVYFDEGIEYMRDYAYRFVEERHVQAK